MDNSAKNIGLVALAFYLLDLQLAFPFQLDRPAKCVASHLVAEA